MPVDSLILQALNQVGALPVGFDPTEIVLPIDVESLCEIWKTAARQTRGSRRARSERVAGWLARQHERGAAFSVRLPNIPDDVEQHWLGCRLFWWTRGLPDRPVTVIVSSRIGRKLEEQGDWLNALRLACGCVDNDGQVLATAERTTTAELVQQCAKLFEMPSLSIRLPGRRNLASWFEWLMSNENNQLQPESNSVFVSHPLEGLPAASARDARLAEVPDRDLVPALLADRFWVLHLRRKGNLSRIVEARLAAGCWPAESLRLLTGSGLVDGDLARCFQDQGAIAWSLQSISSTNPEEDARPTIDTASMRTRSDGSRAALLDELRTPGTFLTHWTRRPSGPWPGESTNEFLNEIILADAPPDRSEFATLRRILQDDRLRASPAGNRDGHAVVSFSARSLPEILQSRTWRNHRMRWDCEPYGLCIRRVALERLGARPVCYGDDELWGRLASSDRPWFQKQFSEAKSGVIDWSVEKEWRICGDVRLTGFDETSVLVFVATEVEAEQLRSDSRWPVVSVERFLHSEPN